MKAERASFAQRCRATLEASPVLSRLALPVLRRLRYWGRRLRYASLDGYNAPKYWADRHGKYGFDLRGVGYEGISHAENERIYRHAAQVFLEVCRREGLNFADIRMLDIGCGTGYYADVFQKNGGKHYVGVDITDVLLEELRRRSPAFVFSKLDICEQELSGAYDLIAMIDVTQHITSEKGFALAMANVRNCLSSDGVLVVTSWLTATSKSRQFFEVARPLAEYRRHFPGFEFGQPVPFRDKFIFTVRRGGVPQAGACRRDAASALPGT
jgi:SAM-dependent methyltransferase